MTTAEQPSERAMAKAFELIPEALCVKPEAARKMQELVANALIRWRNDALEDAANVKFTPEQEWSSNIGGYDTRFRNAIRALKEPGQ